MSRGASSPSARPTPGWAIWSACIACLALLAIPGSALGFGPISTFGSAGAGAGQLSQPQGLAVGPEGYVYLANAGNSRVDVFTATGAYVRSLGKAPVPVPGGCEKDENICDDGTGQAGVLRFPRDVAVDPAGNVFVANTGNQRIDVFSPAGAFLRAFGKDVNPAGGDVCTEASQCKRGTGGTGVAAISSPNGIALDSAGLVYVAGGNYRVDVFTPAGAYVRRIGKELTPSGECKDDDNCAGNTESELAGAMKPPQDVGIDASGRVAVADAQNFRIDVFTSTGAFLHAFGKGVNPAGGDVCTAATGCKKGTESGSAGGLAFADALAVAASGSLYVADSRNHRVNEFRFDGTFVRAFGEGVVSGGTAFEICTTASGCKAGRASTNVGSVAEVRGTTLDCTGAVYAAESMPGVDGENKDAPTAFRIERFGEPSTGYPPCGKPAGPGAAAGSTSAALLTDAPLGPASGRPSTAKPSIKVELNRGSGTASLVVIVSDPGALLLKGKGIRTVKTKVKRPGLVELLVTAKGALKSKLEETGKATVKLTLVFKADNGASNTQTKAIGLKMVGLF
jgi:DNA-binding beta-propeller fold protein YncE